MYFWKFASAATFLVLSTSANASIVHMETSLGSIDIELFDNQAPVTVANFISYVQDGDYANSFIHRSVPGFVIQGGGFKYESNTFSSVPVDAPIVNEFSLSNVRGTIAMATLSGDPDSATSQWFFNLADNSANLDFQNGGFTVFGKVLGSGMDIVDAIAALPTHPFLYNINPAFTDVPLNGWDGTFTDVPDFENQLVKINTVTVSAVPIPAAVWLFGSGLVCLVGLGRRKKA